MDLEIMASATAEKFRFKRNNKDLTHETIRVTTASNPPIFALLLSSPKQSVNASYLSLSCQKHKLEHIHAAMLLGYANGLRFELNFLNICEWCGLKGVSSPKLMLRVAIQGCARAPAAVMRMSGSTVKN